MPPIVGIVGKMYIPRKRNGWAASSIGLFFFFFGIYYVPGILLSVSHILSLLAPHITLVSSCHIQENKSQEGFILSKILISQWSPGFVLFNTSLYCLPLDSLG